jgi:hypothetical protein
VALPAHAARRGDGQLGWLDIGLRTGLVVHLDTIGRMAARPYLALLLVCMPMACADAPSGADDAIVETSGEDRGPPGKADAVGYCATQHGDVCGGPSDDGCWCDDECAAIGDCCSDYDEVCGPACNGEDCEVEPPSCARNVVLMGYWPPTNEMLRQWSTNPLQNPGEWTGENWRGLGYDVHAFFPEFPPDGDPTQHAIGEDGAVGSPEFDLRVDYQATSADFWRIVDTYEPIIVVTTSRGGEIGWEIEAVEGGHGLDNPGDPSRDWMSDRHGDEHFPTQATIEPRSWDAISEFRQGVTLPTALPVQAIFDAASALGTASVEVDETGTSGNFLSGFLGLHGLYYNLLAEHNVAAGHIHVGFGMPVETAEALIETTLEAVLLHHPATQAECP